MSQAMEAQSNVTNRWVTFKLDNETYGIDVMQIREVLRGTEISPVPGAPPFVLGIINLRGNVVAIVDTRNRFGLPAQDMDDASRILILESGDYVVGFLVDSVHEVVELKSSDIEPAPDTGSASSTRFISGLCNRGDGLLIMVDAQKMLSDEDRAELESI